MARNAKLKRRPGTIAGAKRGTPGLGSKVTAFMRGDVGTPSLVLELHRLFRLHSHEGIGNINKFILFHCFKINVKDHGTSLRFSSKQLAQLAELVNQGPGQIEDNWARITTDYIVTNADRISAWIDFNRSSSGKIARQEPDAVKSDLLALSTIDQQSLYSMRLYASLHAYSDTAISEYIKGNLTSPWVKSRLLYPLIYYAVNRPSDNAFRQMLDHLLPVDVNKRAEQKLIQFLLGPDRTLDVSLSYRCYVGLMSHPFDALEYITQYCELIASERSQPSKIALDCLAELSATFPDHRISRLTDLLNGGSLPLLEVPTNIDGISFDPDINQEMLSIIDSNVQSPAFNSTFPLTKALSSLRWNLYPVKADYEILDVYRTRFSMLSTGTFVDWVCRSLFLFEREDYRLEKLMLFRGALMCGGIFPLLMMGPTGPHAMDAWSNGLIPGPSKVAAAVEATFGQLKPLRTDRLWIAVSNWDVAHLQRQGKLLEWAMSARAIFPIWLEPRYLSGLDWRWLTDVIKQVGVLPLRGNPNGIYVLFLRQVEENLREYSALRIALEPFIKRGQVEVFFDWLVEEYGADALAMVRIFLSPDTILKLRLAENYTAALTARLTLLETGVRKFGFIGGVLSEQDLGQEAANLTASLSRMSLGARQFELPWETLRADAATRNQAAYDAYLAMVGAMGGNAAMTNTKRTSTYPFSGGAIVEYEARNRDWPLVLTIAGVIDTFLSHPTAGIEAILSVRIRHDAFRREIIAAIQQVGRSQMPGVRRSTSQAFEKEAEPALSRQVNGWLDTRMHTLRKGKEQALFDFAPSRQEMALLLDAALQADDLEGVIDVVLGWIRPRLEECLVGARTALAEELCPRLRAKLLEVEVGVRASSDRPLEVDRIALATGDALERRVTALQEWFRVPERPRDQSLTLHEIYLAVQQRFLPYGKGGALVFGELPRSISTLSVRPEHIRHMYDLLSEVAQNAIKHGARSAIRLRLMTDVSANGRRLIASNLTTEAASTTTEIEGHPYVTLTDSLFGEGKSGCKKIAYLSASIRKAVSTTSVVRKRGSFHVVVPLPD